MVELPKNEAELQALLDQKEKEVTDTLTAKHNNEMASQRKKHDDELKKAKEQANMTAEQIAEQKYKEQQENDAKELAELRSYKKQTIIGEKLAKEGMPSYFKNDNRLLTAEEGDLDKVIKDIKKEYEADKPKGATHSTIVQQAAGTPKGNQTGDAVRDAAIQAGADALAQALGKK